MIIECFIEENNNTLRIALAFCKIAVILLLVAGVGVYVDRVGPVRLRLKDWIYKKKGSVS